MDKFQLEDDRNPVGLVLLSNLHQNQFLDQSVVIIIKHDKIHGSFGLCINHPLRLTLNDFDEKKWDCLDYVPVFRGGSIAPNQIIITAMCWDASHQRLNWRLGLEQSQIRNWGTEDSNVQFKAYCGYMNWLPGELESDIHQQHWLPIPLPSKRIFSISNQKLWNTLMLQFYPLIFSNGILPKYPSEN